MGTWGVKVNMQSLCFWSIFKSTCAAGCWTHPQTMGLWISSRDGTKKSSKSATKQSCGKVLHELHDLNASVSYNSWRSSLKDTKSNLRDTSQNEQNTWCNIINFITSAMSRSTRPWLASLDTSGWRQILGISLSAIHSSFHLQHKAEVWRIWWQTPGSLTLSLPLSNKPAEVAMMLWGHDALGPCLVSSGCKVYWHHKPATCGGSTSKIFGFWNEGNQHHQQAMTHRNFGIWFDQRFRHLNLWTDH